MLFWGLIDGQGVGKLAWLWPKTWTSAEFAGWGLPLPFCSVPRTTHLLTTNSKEGSRSGTTPQWMYLAGLGLGDCQIGQTIEQSNNLREAPITQHDPREPAPHAPEGGLNSAAGPGNWPRWAFRIAFSITFPNFPVLCPYPSDAQWLSAARA